VGLESPEPLASLYSREYFRATWITTALDAGYWTAMHLKPFWFRDVCSVVFTIYYLACAEQADEVCRRVRGTITVEHLRISWNKSQTPILGWATRLVRPRFIKFPPRPFMIDRPAASDYREPVEAVLYFDGTIRDLKKQDKIVLDIPGGGFVAMNPRCHDDKLLAWAAKLKLPVIALDYKKAPEYPYPYALNECFDVYYQIVATRGRCVGLSGEVMPRIIVAGDSAGGNLAVGMILRLLDGETQPEWISGGRGNPLPLPEALVATYPALEMSIGSWMNDEQLALLRTPERRQENKRILERKKSDYRRIAKTPHGSDNEDDEDRPENPFKEEKRPSTPALKVPRTRLAMSSIISYFNDRVLSPEMLRAMILLYVGPHNRPDFETDYFLSPLRAPEVLLAKFPRTLLMCGERDPLVDDTAIFAGRLRKAHLQEFKRRQELGLESDDAVFNDKKHVEVVMVDGVSHGFFQFVGVYPKGWEYIHACSQWMRDVFDDHDHYHHDSQTPSASASTASLNDYFSYSKSRRNSDASDDRPLEIPSKLRMTSMDDPHHKKSRSKRSSTPGRGAINRPHHHKHGHKGPAASRGLISKLSSTEDLLERRMNAVTDSLMDPTTRAT
jgi:acetyl esterase/lipase